MTKLEKAAQDFANSIHPNFRSELGHMPNRALGAHQGFIAGAQYEQKRAEKLLKALIQEHGVGHTMGFDCEVCLMIADYEASK